MLVLDYTLDYYNYMHHNNITAQEQVDNLFLSNGKSWPFGYLEGTLSQNEKIHMASKYTTSAK